MLLFSIKEIPKKSDKKKKKITGKSPSPIIPKQGRNSMAICSYKENRMDMVIIIVLFAIKKLDSYH
jgi:hypothetical protein